MRPLNKPLPIGLTIALAVIALVGFVDAAYLTVEHYQNVIPPCSITGGCERVLTSPYATVAGIPVSLIGSVYYILILIGILAYLEGRNEKLLRYALSLSVLGFLASIYLVYLQLAIIHSICAYCIGSALTSTLLFIGALIVFYRYGNTAD